MSRWFKEHELIRSLEPGKGVTFTLPSRSEAKKLRASIYNAMGDVLLRMSQWDSALQVVKDKIQPTTEQQAANLKVWRDAKDYD